MNLHDFASALQSFDFPLLMNAGPALLQTRTGVHPLYFGLAAVLIGAAVGYGIGIARKHQKSLTSSEDRARDADDYSGLKIDPLTGVATRSRFEDLLASEWHESYRHGTPISVILVDIDLFNSFNEVYGKARGDECLKQIASRLTSELRKAGDRVARYDGERFAVILQTYLEGAAAVAERLRESVEQLGIPHQEAPGKTVTISLGVAAAFPRDGFSYQVVISAAEQAMNRAKHGGRNRVNVAQTVGGV